MFLLRDFSVERLFSDLTSSSLSYATDLPSSTTLFSDNPQADDSPSNGTGTCCCGGFCQDNAHASNVDPANISYVTDFTALLNPITFNGDFSRWNGDASGAAVGTTFITYSFIEADELPDPANVARTPDAVWSYTDVQRDATRLALEEFSKISGIVFLEVEGDSMMDFLGVTGSNTGGYAFYPFSGRRDGGGVYIEGTELTDFSEGTGTFQVILHEIGHAVGLKHPFEGDIRLDQATDNTDNTVMSYTWQGAAKTELPSLDFDAVQFLYGTAEASGKNDIVWSWDETNDIFTATGTGGDDQISGTNFQNTIDAGAGDDVVLGGAQDDVLTGGDGNDRLVGADGNNQLDGGNGNDLLTSEWGNDILIGGEGDDILTSQGGNDSLSGGAGNDQLSTTSGTNTLDGGAGNDILTSQGSSDTLIGGTGDDTFQLYYLWSSITLEGGDGYDVVSFANSSNTGGAFLNLSFLPNVSGIEEFRGSAFNDTFIGDDGGNRFFGEDGDDRLSSGAGIDYLDGGNGFDTLEFDFSSGALVVDLAANTVSGGEGEGDTILNFEAVRGGSGDDILLGTEGDNTFFYYGGSDTYDGRGGSDTINTQYYSNVRVNLEAGTLEWRSGDNFISFGTFVFTSIENAEGGFSNDFLIGDAGENILNGGNGDDELTGGGGADTFKFVSISENSFGNDTITDFAIGSDIVDLRELSSNAIVSTRVVDGNMVIEVATTGGAIDSTITFDGISASEWSRQSFVLSTDFVGTSANDVYNGTASADLALGLGGSDTLSGGDGADELYGGDGNDLISGGRQNDMLFGGDGNDVMLGELGADVLYGGAGNDLVLGGNRDDRLFGEDGDDRTFGGNGNDVVDGGAGVDILRGGSQDDILNGGIGDDIVFGGTGRDSILGGDGDDQLFGRGGFDALNGGAGNDRLEGGVQADRFIFDGAFGNDTITDFAATNDSERIDLTGVDAISDFTDLMDNHMNQVGADVVIDDGLGNTITLLGITLSDLDAADFVF